MALKPHLWAYDDAPVQNPTAVLVLLALADEAADDGTGACPYVDKLARRARVSVRSVQNYLRQLYQDRIIDLGDIAVSQQRYRRSAAQSPRCWNLNLSATWDSIPTPRTEEEMQDYSPFIGKKPARRTKPDQPSTAEVQDLHPTGDQAKRDDGTVPSTEVQDLHPCKRCNGLHLRGAASCTGEVQPIAPILSSPLEPGSVTASQLRRDVVAHENPSHPDDGQITITGEVEKLPAKRSPDEIAENNSMMGIASGWLTFRADHDCPMVWGKTGDPKMALRGMISAARTAGYSDDEIKWALMRTDRSVPDVAALEQSLVQVRRGWRPPENWKPGDARTNAPGTTAGRPSTTDARVNAGLDLAEKFRLEEAS